MSEADNPVTLSHGPAILDRRLLKKGSDNNGGLFYE
jgi:hypothetical protein